MSTYDVDRRKYALTGCVAATNRKVLEASANRKAGRTVEPHTDFFVVKSKDADLWQRRHCVGLKLQTVDASRRSTDRAKTFGRNRSAR
jgi:hypothetical protein